MKCLGKFREFVTWTTLTTKQRENGMVRKMRKTEIKTRRWAQNTWPSSQAEWKNGYTSDSGTTNTTTTTTSQFLALKLSIHEQKQKKDSDKFADN